MAIADVAAYVLPDSALDREALKRGNSVYFPDRVVPMLPERISNDLCSLREKPGPPCPRRAHDFRRRRPQDQAFVPPRHDALVRPSSPIRRRRRRSTAARTTRPGRSSTAVLKPLWAAYDVLKRGRDAREPLELDLPERKIMLKPDGTVDRVVVPDRLDAHKLIEEFMIQANVAAAETLEAKRQRAGLPHPRRALARQAGIAARVPADASACRWRAARSCRPVAVQPASSKRVDGADNEQLVNEVVLRSQSQAEYSPDNIGHFGLNLRRYAHFTSPIRRYADLIVHRALIAALGFGKDGITPSEEARLEEIAGLISAAERRAMAAERDTVDRLIAAYLAERIGETFDGRISGVDQGRTICPIAAVWRRWLHPGVIARRRLLYLRRNGARPVRGAHRQGLPARRPRRGQAAGGGAAGRQHALRDADATRKPLPGGKRSFHKAKRASASQAARRAAGARANRRRRWNDQVFGGEHHSGRPARAAVDGDVRAACSAAAPIAAKASCFASFLKTVDSSASIAARSSITTAPTTCRPIWSWSSSATSWSARFMSVEATSALSHRQQLAIWIPLTDRRWRSACCGRSRAPSSACNGRSTCTASAARPTTSRPTRKPEADRRGCAMDGLTKAQIDTSRSRQSALGGKPMRPRDAATLILIDRSGGGFNVLMGRRHAAARLHAGQVRLSRRPHRSRPTAASRWPQTLHPHEAGKAHHRQHGRTSAARARAIALSAIRETYEEAGLLIGRKGAFATDQARLAGLCRAQRAAVARNAALRRPRHHAARAGAPLRHALLRRLAGGRRGRPAGRRPDQRARRDRLAADRRGARRRHPAHHPDGPGRAATPPGHGSRARARRAGAVLPTGRQEFRGRPALIAFRASVDHARQPGILTAGRLSRHREARQSAIPTRDRASHDERQSDQRKRKRPGAYALAVDRRGDRVDQRRRHRHRARHAAAQRHPGNRGHSASMIGLNTAVAGLASLAAAPLATPLAMRFGVVWTMLAMIVVGAFAFVGFYFAPRSGCGFRCGRSCTSR